MALRATPKSTPKSTRTKSVSSRWLPGLRALLTIGQALRGIEAQLRRQADVMEGVQVAQVSPVTPEDPVTIAYASDEDFALQFGVELELTKTLGRPPTSDEVCAYLDGVEPGELPRLMRGGIRAGG